MTNYRLRLEDYLWRALDIQDSTEVCHVWSNNHIKELLSLF